MSLPKPPALIFINEANMIKEIAGIDISRNEMTEAQLIIDKLNDLNDFAEKYEDAEMEQLFSQYDKVFKSTLKYTNL
jgi:hypothetical protein